MLPVLEAVPNISEGRNLELVSGIVDAVRATGADVLDWSADPDHHRSVITFVGDPATVERAAVEVARISYQEIDLRHHTGVHPRVGALDVLPLVPLNGVTLAEACDSARRVGQKLEELGVPVYFYGAASTPPGRSLFDIRRGGFEALQAGFPQGREPDLSAGLSGAHASAGVTCVGAREVLLAWNVFVEGVELAALESLAASLRESGGGWPGLRALAFELPSQGKLQLSMNLERAETASPFKVFEAVEAGVSALGGAVAATQVIGMIPGALVYRAAINRLRLLEPDRERTLPVGLSRHLQGRLGREVAHFLQVVQDAGEVVPPEVIAAARHLAQSVGELPVRSVTE